MAPPYQWLVLLSLAMSVQSRTIAPDPTRCFPKSPSFYFSVTPVDEKIFFVPVGDVVSCLSKVRIDKAFALDAVDSFNDILKAGYGYYYYNNDILKSSPIANPFGWEIFNGTSGGQVDYDKEFQALRQDIEAKGHADGMLAYKINDILLRAKDAHTSCIMSDMNILSLFDESPETVPSWLSLQMNNKGEVQVVNNIPMNGSIYDGETKVVRSINEEDPLSYLDKLVSNPAIGSQSQYKSPGVRMNVFLDNINFKTPKQKWTSTNLGDISNLPEGLMLEYEDGSTANWTFVVLVPDIYMYSLPHEIGKMMSQKSTLYTGFKEFKDGKRVTVLRREKQIKSKMSQKKYLVVPDDQLGFEQFKATSAITEELETYSGFVIRGDAMVWKLPTFAGNEDGEDLINFWNAMAAQAQDKNIHKLIIDMSNNGGGYVHNVLVCIKLLYPDARTDNVIPISNTRVTDVMYNIDNVASAALDINNKVDWNHVTDIVFNDLSEAERIDIFSSFCTPMLNFDVVTQGTDISNFGNSDWYSLGSATNSIVDFCEKDSKLWRETDVVEFFEAIFGSIVPPRVSEKAKSDNNTVEVIESIQSGTSVPVTTASRYLVSEFETLSSMDARLTSGEIIKSPFNSYILFSNSAEVGSGAHMFQTSLKYLSQKYPKLQSLKTVSMGCMGDRLQCAMASFAGQVVKGSPWISEIYGLFAVTGTVKVILETDRLLQGSNITLSDVKAYGQSYERLRDSLPAPPALSSELPQFASRPFFYDGIPPNSTIPVEYFNIPADFYLQFWPAPRTTTFENQASLGYIYDTLLTMFA